MTDTSDVHEPSRGVAFVVVNWNQRDLTLDCLTSLGLVDHRPFEVILVDNGSEDDSVARVRERFPHVHIHENHANLGIAAANNVGIRWALDRGFQYIFLLNNDTIVDPRMLAEILEVSESESDIGIVGPTMLFHERPDVVNCAGNRIDWKDAATHLLDDGRAYASIEELPPRTVDFISTCAACIKREVFESIGVMDERYFIYYDETDWFVRASRAGWRTVHVPGARIWHRVSATMRPSSPVQTYYMTRNRLLFIGKHTSGSARLAIGARALFQEVRAVISHSVRARHRELRGTRAARCFAVRDALARRFGPMGRDVAVACAPRPSR